MSMAPNSMNGERKFTEPLTTRIDRPLLQKLRDEANKNEVSLNSLVTHIFKQHVDWHTNASKAGFISVRRGLLTKLMEKVDEKDLLEIAEFIAKNEARSFILLLRNEYNITSAIDVFETWIKIVGYPYRHDFHFGRHSFVLNHNMGRKWSIFILTMYQLIFEDFGIKLEDVDIDENMITFGFDLP
jgi:hypothetical protein